MRIFSASLSLFVLFNFLKLVESTCVDDCYLANIPQTGCPGAADPNSPATPAYIQCVCPTTNLVNYLACVNAGCNAPGVLNFFQSQCTTYGGIGPQGSMRLGRRQFQPRGRSIRELQARVPRAVVSFNPYDLTSNKGEFLQ
ncbi:hypothetical protein T439DRAFT_327814 [Meredithblackwellia eburnea MCA 4105]